MFHLDLNIDYHLCCVAMIPLSIGNLDSINALAKFLDQCLDPHSRIYYYLIVFDCFRYDIEFHRPDGHTVDPINHQRNSLNYHRSWTGFSNRYQKLKVRRFFLFSQPVI